MRLRAISESRCRRHTSWKPSSISAWRPTAASAGCCRDWRAPASLTRCFSPASLSRRQTLTDSESSTGLCRQSASRQRCASSRTISRRSLLRRLPGRSARSFTRSSRASRRRWSSSRTCRRPRWRARSSPKACRHSSRDVLRSRDARSRPSPHPPPRGGEGMTELRQAVIVATARTPMGRYGGQLKDVRPDDLAAIVLKEVCERARVEPAEVEDVILGCANGAGEDNRNVARMALLLAGFPVEVPGQTVNRLCGSGMQATVAAAREIQTGAAEVMIAGGVESMTRAPWVMPKPDGAFPRGPQTVYDTALGWRLVNPRMAELYGTLQLGETAERVAAKYEVDRTAQDEFADRSHKRAVAAQEAGIFGAEIVPVEVTQKKGEPLVLTSDEGPRADSSTEALGKLRPAFQKD